MAKKSKAEPSHWDEVDSGIFKRRRIPLNRSDRPVTAEEKATARQVLAEAFAPGPTLDREFAELRSWLIEVAKAPDEAFPFIERDARSANMDLVGLSQILAGIKSQVESRVYREVEKAVEWSMRLGRKVEQINVRALEEFTASGRRLMIDRPEQLKEGRKVSAAEQRRENRELALESLNWARKNFPTEAADANIKFLKRRAAEQLKITVSTLNRWLRPPK